MFDLLDFETVADASSAATAGASAGDDPSPTAPAVDPAAEGGETDPSAVATEAAPADAPEYLTAEDAAAIADARFQQLLEQMGAGEPTAAGDAAAGGELNLNEFLDPYGENFGTNLATVLSNVVQRVEQNLAERFQPIDAQAAQAAQTGHDELLTTAINDTAAGLGGLKGGDAAVQRVMVAVRTQFMPEAARVYGNTDRAAQVAIDRAIRAERDYQTAIAGGAAGDVEHIAAIAGVRTRPRRWRFRRRPRDAPRPAALDAGTRREVRTAAAGRTHALAPPPSVPGSPFGKPLLLKGTFRDG